MVRTGFRGAVPVPLSPSSPPVIRVPCEDGARAVELLGEEQAHEEMGPGEAAEGEAPVGLGQCRRVEAVGAADQEGEVAALVPPLAEAPGQLAAGDVLATFVEGDEDGVLGKRAQETGGLALALARHQLGEPDRPGASGEVAPGQAVEIGVAIAAEGENADLQPGSAALLAARSRSRGTTCQRRSMS